jgi:ADP-heptose:LPS heptosyltransferase
MKKIKHSKFKNTGFIFELLVRQITAEIISSNKSVAETILKENFNGKKELSKELKLYQYLINEKYNSESKADQFITTILEARKSITSLKRLKKNMILMNL